MKVKAVLFDLFDTLLLVKDGETFYMPALAKLHHRLVEEKVNVPFEDFKRVYFEVRDKLYAEAAEKMEEPHFNVRVSRTLQAFGYDYDVSHPIVRSATDVFAEEFMRYVVMDSEATEVLEKLHADYRLGVVSNFAIPECLNQLFEKFSLDRFFDVVIISGAVNIRKPNPAIFQMALRALNLKAEEAVFVGDTPSMDVKGAKNVGMHAILIDRESQFKHASEPLIYRFPGENIQIEPDKVIDNLSELLSVLRDCHRTLLQD